MSDSVQPVGDPGPDAADQQADPERLRVLEREGDVAADYLEGLSTSPISTGTSTWMSKPTAP